MPELTIPLEGGLNLQDDPTQCPPGTCRDGLNFEVTQQAGYSLRQGWCGYDGSILGTELQDFLFINALSGWNSTDAKYGEQITITLAGPNTVNLICIGWTDLGAGKGLLVLANSIGGTAYTSLQGRTTTAVAGTISGFALSGTQTIMQAGVFSTLADPFVSGAGLSPFSYNYILQTIIATQQIPLAVPGNPLSGLDASFLLADNTYAIHDCIVFLFNSGTSANVGLLEGHIIKSVGGATTYGTVLSYGVIIGDWTAGTAQGWVVVYDVPLGTAYPANNTQMNAYSADGTTSLGNIFKYTSANSLLAYPAIGRSLMYKTSDQTAGRTTAFAGWTRVPLTREIQYSQAYAGQTTGIGFGPVGGSPFSIYEYSRQGLTTTLATLTPISSGPVAGTPGFYGCTTATNVYPWTNINNIKLDDGANATAVLNGGDFNRDFKALGFSLSDVPTASTILGITVKVHWNATTAANRLLDYKVNLIKPDGTMTVGRESNTFVPTAPTNFTYGGVNDVWGYGWKWSDVTNANFGVYFNVKNPSGLADTANVDFVGLQVTYLPPSRIVYIRNALAAAPTDVPAFIVHYTTDNNTQFASNNAVGTLTIVGTGLESAFTAAGKTRTIGAGEQIRDAPAGGGSLLGWTTSTDLPTSFPGGGALNSNGSRWEWSCYNFYSDPSAQIALGANGVEYGIGFDGTYTIRTRTGRRADLDNPRHVIGYCGNVHWGYNSGDVLVSAPGRPFTVAGLQLSQAYNISQPIAGMAELAGQILAVFGTRTVYGFEGTDPLNYTRRTLSPSLGAFEYTVANVEGSVLWTSFRGIETMQTTNAYGEFETVPLSQASTPWLQPRLQNDSRIAIVNQRPICALAVRNKRQYRLFFADGYTFSLTRFGPGGIPMGMPGKYSQGANTVVPRHVFQGIRSDGKEVLYACMDLIQNPNTYAGLPTLGKLDIGIWEGATTNVTQGYFELNPVYPYLQNNKITPNTFCEYQDISLFAATLSGSSSGGTIYNNISVYAVAGDDIPMSVGNYAALPTTASVKNIGFAPMQNILFLPLPVFTSTCTIGAEGRMIRLRIDTTLNLPGPFRATKITSTYKVQGQETV